ncbi:MAG: hypothetical protein F4X19_02870 [Acidobacteria bacterium]|nr:hypothetical protein [Acidobacteriota bacterium]MYC81021.1 hypothetical protein [Acidobacteriota bacterium]
MHSRYVPLSFPAMWYPSTLPAGTAWTGLSLPEMATKGTKNAICDYCAFSWRTRIAHQVAPEIQKNSSPSVKQTLSLVDGNRFKVKHGQIFTHIDAQDIQDSFQETASLSCRESAKPHRIIA